jgi:sigma-B regulation protein RsbU (phosphoserine phosphatase)
VTKDNSLFIQNALQLQKMDTFLLYTDGVTEAMNKEKQLFQEYRLEEILKAHYKLPLRELLGKILLKVQNYSWDMEQSDDITLFALRVLE